MDKNGYLKQDWSHYITRNNTAEQQLTGGDLSHTRHMVACTQKH